MCPINVTHKSTFVNFKNWLNSIMCTSKHSWNFFYTQAAPFFSTEGQTSMCKGMHTGIPSHRQNKQGQESDAEEAVHSTTYDYSLRVECQKKYASCLQKNPSTITNLLNKIFLINLGKYNRILWHIHCNSIRHYRKNWILFLMLHRKTKGDLLSIPCRHGLCP